MSAVTPPNGWETRFIGLESRAELADDRRTIIGYGIVFHTKSLDLGGFREVIVPEAVDRTLREGIDVRSYYNHSPDKVLGRVAAGTLRMKKDRTGLRVEITPPDTTYAKDLLESIKRGDVSGMSFRFRTIEDRWHVEDEEPIRELVDMRIGEIGPVSEPAYESTSADVRSVNAEALRSLDAFRTQASGRTRDWFERRLRAVGVR